MAHSLLDSGPMDMTALARLHAALDLVMEAKEQLDSIGSTSPTLERARFLTGETRELIGALLASRTSGSSAGVVRPRAAARRVR